MSFEKGEWTLICYAGSASQASINSRPVGSELGEFVGDARSARQVISSCLWRVRVKRTHLESRNFWLNRFCSSKFFAVLSASQIDMIGRLPVKDERLPLTPCDGSKKQKGPRRPRTLMSTGKFPILGYFYNVAHQKPQGRPGIRP
jgi:hypothetical protein